MPRHRLRSTAAALLRRLCHALRSKIRARGAPRVIAVRPSTKAAAPSLRPPTLMIDLLFGALMLFAFQMGDPSARRIVAQEFELPTADGKAPQDRASLLPLKPSQGPGGGWRYELPDGRRLGPDDVGVLVTRRSLTAVLLVPGSAPVQAYLDAEQPLRRRGLKVGLAVATEGSRP